MKKLIIANYISYTDRNGIPVGHPLKVCGEYIEWLRDAYGLTFAAHTTYLDALDGKAENVLPLAEQIREGNDYSSLRGRFHQLFVSFRNIKQIFKSGADVVLFCDVDIFLFFYLLVHPFRRKKTVIVSYLEKMEKKSHDRIFQYIAKRVKLFIFSNRLLMGKLQNGIYIPDFLYDEKIYQKYRAEVKQDKVVCLGVMNQGKRLEELVEAFTRTELRLEICGHFADKERYARLLEMASGCENIHIEDSVLPYEDYMERLSRAKYCILPYRVGEYATKTSGVVLESIYSGVVPIVPEQLIQAWEVNGIPYENFEEIGDMVQEIDVSAVIEANNQLIYMRFDKRKYECALIDKMNA